jgi:hypothetical protein
VSFVHDSPRKRGEVPLSTAFERGARGAYGDEHLCERERISLGGVSPTGCATRCIMGRSPEARDRARGDQRSCWCFGKRKEHFASSNWQKRRLHHQKNWNVCCKLAYNLPGSMLLCVPGHGKTRGFAFTSNGSTSCDSRISKRWHTHIQLIVFPPGSSQECSTVSTLAVSTSSPHRG